MLRDFAVAHSRFAPSSHRRRAGRRVGRRCRAGCGIKGPLRPATPPPTTPSAHRDGAPAAARAGALHDAEVMSAAGRASHMSVFAPGRRRAPRRGCPACSHRRALRHAVLRLFARRHRKRLSRVRRRLRRAAAPRLLRRQGELQPRGAESARASGLRLRHRVWRRARARDRGGRRSEARSCSRAWARPPPKMEAALAAGILCFNVESAAELDLARRRRRTRRQASRRCRSA